MGIEFNNNAEFALFVIFGIPFHVVMFFWEVVPMWARKWYRGEHFDSNTYAQETLDKYAVDHSVQN